MSYEVTITYYEEKPEVIIRKSNHLLVEIDGIFSLFYMRTTKSGKLYHLHREEGKCKDTLLERMENDPAFADVECKFNLNLE